MPSQKDHDRLALLHEAPSGAICKLIRLCPGRYGHRYPLVDWVVSPLPELCERERLALAVDYGDDCEWLPWEEVVRFARTFTSLPVLLIGNWAADAVVSAALDVTANLLVEVQPALAAEQLGALVRGFGSHRFVFGSARSVDADQPAGKFATDLLDEEDAAAILGGNAEGLESGAWSERFL